MLRGGIGAWPCDLWGSGCSWPSGRCDEAGSPYPCIPAPHPTPALCPRDQAGPGVEAGGHQGSAGPLLTSVPPFLHVGLGLRSIHTWALLYPAVALQGKLPVLSLCLELGVWAVRASGRPWGSGTAGSTNSCASR